MPINQCNVSAVLQLIWSTCKTSSSFLADNEVCRVSTEGMAAQVVLTAGVLVDAMGAFSPIAAQARRGRKPDSVVLMVGSCSQGLPSRAGADLLYSFVPINK